MGRIFKKSLVAALLMSVAGCAVDSSMDRVLTRDGFNGIARDPKKDVESRNDEKRGLDYALENDFIESMKAAYTQNKDLTDKFDDSKYQTVNNKNYTFTLNGFALARARCVDFFDRKDPTQLEVDVWRDAITYGGALATALLGLTKASSDSVAAVALATGAGKTGIDIYAKHYLFGAENISAVKIMVLSALDEHKKTFIERFRESVRHPDPANPLLFEFSDAYQQITTYQSTCSYQQIRALAQRAIKEATLTPTDEAKDTVKKTVDAQTNSDVERLFSTIAQLIKVASISKEQGAAIVRLSQKPTAEDSEKVAGLLGTLKDGLWDSTKKALKITPDVSAIIAKKFEKLLPDEKKLIDSIISEKLSPAPAAPKQPSGKPASAEQSAPKLSIPDTIFATSNLSSPAKNMPLNFRIDVAPASPKQ
jgi:hypothetical protein